MKKVKRIDFCDSITLVSPTGQRASNLKEFLHILEESEEKVVFHHLYQSHMRTFQKMGEFPNDFANWAAYGLEDITLAEKLANFDPYDLRTVADVKHRIIEIVEDHMYDLPTIPWVRPGSEFYFSSATTIILPLDISAGSIEEFREAMDIIPDTSLYFHFYEERKRHKDKEHDDFTIWIENNFEAEDLVKKIRDIDFYFFALGEIRKKIIHILDEYLQGSRK